MSDYQTRRNSSRRKNFRSEPHRLRRSDSDKNDIEYKDTEIQVSDQHAFLPIVQVTPSALKDTTDSEIMQSLSLRILLFKFFQIVLEKLHQQKRTCIQDFETYFKIHHINVSSKNGEAFWVHLATGSLKKVRFVLKLSQFHESSTEHVHLLNRLVLKYKMPHIPLTYGYLFCPEERCQFVSPEKTKSLTEGGCSVFFQEYLNGGTLRVYLSDILVKLPMPEAEVILANLIIQTCFAILGLHKHLNMTHCDTHLDNIMLSEQKNFDARKSKNHVVQYRIGSSTYLLPFMGITVYLIDYDFLGDSTYLSEDQKPMFKLDYYRLLEDILSIARSSKSSQAQKVFFSAVIPPPVKTYCMKELMPLDKIFFRKKSYEATFSYVPIQWCEKFLHDLIQVYYPSAIQDFSSSTEHKEIIAQYTI